MKERKNYSTAEHTKPDYDKPRPVGTLWCPYDGEWLVFEPRQEVDYYTYPRCVECGISDEDFWVKTANGLWENSKSKKG